MIQEDKELLLRDLCARLPYGVKVQPSGSASPHKFVGYDKSLARIDTDQRFELENIKPYLRPMSSMTEEEKIELCTIAYAPDEMKTIEEKLYVIKTNAKYATDFYNKHHIDYRGLIEKGLAIEAPEGMYK